MEIQFRSLEESYLPLLHAWLNQPHMRPYYQPKPISLEETLAHYGPRIKGQQKTYSHVALIDEKPFGYVQCYKNVDWPQYAAEIDVQDGVSVDLYIGETSFLGKGLGRAMLKKYVETLVFTLFPQETKCYIWHNLNNAVALHCSKTAGFKFVRQVAEKGVLGELLLWEKI